MKGFSREFIAAAKQSPRLYFAPLVGAYRAVLQEWTKIEKPKQQKTSANR